MSYDYSPGIGYGPLRFGMSAGEVRTLLGEPVSFRWPFEGIPIDAETRRMTKDLRFMDFEQTPRSNAFPQVSFDKDKTVAFTLFDKKDPLLLGDINLFHRDREDVLRQLAALNEVYYDNGEAFFFPQSGICIPAKKYARTLPYIILIEPQHQLKRLDFSCYDVSTRYSN